MKLEKEVLGAGCFWHVEEFFSNIKGVNETRVGYACGVTKNPTYKEVCTGETGHVEVVEVIFDPTIRKETSCACFTFCGGFSREENLT